MNDQICEHCKQPLPVTARDKSSDMMILADAFFANLVRDNCEYGGWGIEDKRPFGNSDVTGDILEMLKIPSDGDSEWTREQRNYADSLYDSLGTFLEAEWAKYRGGK